MINERKKIAESALFLSESKPEDEDSLGYKIGYKIGTGLKRGIEGANKIVNSGRNIKKKIKPIFLKKKKSKSKNKK
jgi:hypothetical protein